VVYHGYLDQQERGGGAKPCLCPACILTLPEYISGSGRVDNYIRPCVHSRPGLFVSARRGRHESKAIGRLVEALKVKQEAQKSEFEAYCCVN
jgi:hypothetical protein